MKRLMAVILLLAMALCLAACGEQTETIYVISESTRTIYGQEIKTVHTYSEKGNLIKTEMYLAGELYETLDRRTSNGVVYVTVTEGNSSYVQATRTTYDEQGNPLTVENSVADTVTSRVSYTYDDKGNVLTMKTTNGFGVTLATYTYDDRGNVTSRVVTMEGDEPKTETTHYAYNEQDYAILEETVDAEGNLVRRITHVYGDSADRTTTYYGPDGEPEQVVTSEYDERGNLVKEVTIIDGEEAQVIVNTYMALEVPVEE